MHGYVLTDGKTVDYLYEFLRKDSVDLLKVIPTWGIHWNDFSRSKILSATKDTIIRTTHGDPSRNKGLDANPIDYRYLVPESLYTLAPFLNIKPHCYIELGNEPNAYPNIDYWVYRYWLLETIKICRSKYPYAKLISPAPIVADGYTDSANNFYEICKDALMLCDYSGIHAYEYRSFNDPTGTKQLTTAINMSYRYLGTKPTMLTEYGIDDPSIPMPTKLKLYQKMRLQMQGSIKGFCIFHIEANEKLFPQYAVTLKDI